MSCSREVEEPARSETPKRVQSPPPNTPERPAIDAGSPPPNDPTRSPKEAEAASPSPDTPKLSFSVASKENEPVQRTLKKRLEARLTSCESINGKNATFYLEFSIEADGKVSLVSQLPSDPVAQCVRKAASDLDRVKPRDGGLADLSPTPAQPAWLEVRARVVPAE
jgi:hypothetical protein